MRVRVTPHAVACAPPGKRTVLEGDYRHRAGAARSATAHQSGSIRPAKRKRAVNEQLLVAISSAKNNAIGIGAVA
jgi:hypothetical protein